MFRVAPPRELCLASIASERLSSEAASVWQKDEFNEESNRGRAAEGTSALDNEMGRSAAQFVAAEVGSVDWPIHQECAANSPRVLVFSSSGCVPALGRANYSSDRQAFDVIGPEATIVEQPTVVKQQEARVEHEAQN